MKLVLEEPGHLALGSDLERWQGAISSALLEIEAVRACARYGEQWAELAATGLSAVALLPIDDRVRSEAARVTPATLRTIDALHLASALSVTDEIGVLYSYDERLATAARDYGFTVLAPE